MHKSKLGGFIIDCRTDDLGAAADFWGNALGMPVQELPGETSRPMTSRRRSCASRPSARSACSVWP
jgi:hypothetical protein